MSAGKLVYGSFWMKNFATKTDINQFFDKKL
jgi:hypothetical protein